MQKKVLMLFVSVMLFAVTFAATKKTNTSEKRKSQSSLITKSKKANEASLFQLTLQLSCCTVTFSPANSLQIALTAAVVPGYMYNLSIAYENFACGGGGNNIA